VCGCWWELRPIKAAALPYKYFRGWRSMTSRTAPTLTANTKRETSLFHYCRLQSTTESSARRYPRGPIHNIHRKSGSGTAEGAAESGRDVRPSDGAMADGEAAVSVEWDSSDGGLAE